MSLPEVRSLGHGISVIPVPLPFQSPAWVNCYVLEGHDGLVLIDCGVDWEPGRSRLDHGFEVLGHEMTAVHTLVVSHLHPDHVGMAPRLLEEFAWNVVMHKSAADRYKDYNDTPSLVAWTANFGATNGVPVEVLNVFSTFGRPDWMPLLGPPTAVVDDGDQIHLGPSRSLEVIHTPGHEHSHICLRDTLTGILFSGDHILGKITPVIMWDQTELDVLGLYLNSVGRLVDLEIGLTYPAHGSIVERGSLRAEQILLHHDRRLRTMDEIVHLGPATGWQVMEKSFRPHLDPLEQRLALRETVSHLEHLVGKQRLAKFEEDALVWYRRPLARDR